MSELSNKIINALKAGRTVSITIDGVTTLARPGKTAIVEGEGCEYLEIDEGTTTNLFNLSLINSIDIPH